MHEGEGMKIFKEESEMKKKVMEKKDNDCKQKGRYRGREEGKRQGRESEHAE